MALYKLILVIFLAILTKVLVSAGSHSPKYYPDLTTQNGSSSCTEQIAFATSKDPFYDWITRSYLVEGFETDANITIQQAGSAYQKLSAWRVADKHHIMINSPEPHVVGGSFHQKKTNIIARMAVNWGMSIRICLSDIFGDKGPNMCRYTGQVIAVKENTTLNFRVVLSKEYYNNSQMEYLANWVSNAKVEGAVGVDRKIAEKNKDFWYYSSPELETLCSNEDIVYFRADMAAFLGKSFVECTCVGNVCAQSVDMIAEDGEFKDAVPCNNKSVKSYWIPADGQVFLFSYSSNFDSYFYLSSTLNITTFPNNITKGNVEAMEHLSSCLEIWLAKAHDPSNDISPLVAACNSSLINLNETLENLTNPVLATDLTVVFKSVEEAFKSGDECVETNMVENVCSSSNILAEDQIEEIKSIIANITQSGPEEVRDFAETEWEEMKTERHDLYLNILTAFFAAFTAGWAVSSETLVTLERFIVSWLPKRIVASGEAQVPGSDQAYKEDSQTVRYIRWILRFAALGGVIGLFMYRTWKALSNLKSADPLPAWSKTVQYQKNGFAFLVTITSTYEVKPIWKTMFILGSIMVPYFVLVAYFNYGKIGKSPLFRPKKTQATQMTNNPLST